MVKEDCADAQADLILHLAHISDGTFSHVVDHTDDQLLDIVKVEQSVTEI